MLYKTEIQLASLASKLMMDFTVICEMSESPPAYKSLSREFWGVHYICAICYAVALSLEVLWMNHDPVKLATLTSDFSFCESRQSAN